MAMEYRVRDAEGDRLQKLIEAELAVDETEARVEEIYAFLAMQMGLDYVANQPKDALKKRVGADLDERVGSCLANQLADEVIKREGLAATLEPVVESASGTEPGEAFSCTVRIYLKPELELSSYDPVTLPLSDPEITEDMVDRALATLVDERARLVADEDAQEVGESSICRISMSTTKFGMRVAALSAENMTYQIGQGTLPPEIERELLGMKPGEEKSFSVTITSKNFLGLEVEEPMECTCSVKQILKKETPEVTDEWVRERIPGAYDVASFREMVRQNLEDRAQANFARVRDEACAVALAARLPEELDLPEVHYEYARAGLLQNVSAALSREAMAKEDLFAAQGVSESQFMLQMRTRAAAILRQGLALDALARHEGLALEPADISRALRSISQGDEGQTMKMLEMNGRTYQLREAALRAKARTLLAERAVCTGEPQDSLSS